MARKRAVIIIVEGVSDERALSTITKYAKELFDVHIHFSNGDIFTRASNKGAKAVVGDEIQKVMNETKYTKKDILAVIQITDTDGTFIKDDSVIVDHTLDRKLLYLSDSIKVSEPHKALEIRRRNKNKAHSLKTMYSATTIKKDIPYYLLYFSCNLDHIIHDERNLEEEYKTSKARTFSGKFKNKPDDFLNFFKDNSFVVTGTLKETWDFIQDGHHSLGRYTNFHIIFDILNTLTNKKE
ncbi:hypothetical protein [Paenibacillus sp. 23TSA30-6]|uniref:hypothetical protein n=1 Tax=Paenibacillus sp. 23TSA30-6 TaxID=2546104 RepID=UPI001787A385|nr:hypothetical protein [Paenibacillus sp. 23TSA30-6]MBE0337776.1 hypothetical protein [Paenibacillus sp. 23TSA30-6]